MPQTFENLPRSDLRKRDLETIQKGTLRYTYKGLTCQKNPFDLALSTLLLDKVRPKAIVEIGSGSGGSALWFSDQSKLLSANATIYSLDINPPNSLKIENVHFVCGDINQLEKSALPDILIHCERPLLVIEDGPHTFEGCKSALSFFNPFMRAG